MHRLRSQMLLLTLCAWARGDNDAIVLAAPKPTAAQRKAEERAPITVGESGRPRADLKNAVTLTLEDASGTYTIPYIQSPGELTVGVANETAGVEQWKFSLGGPRKKSIAKTLAAAGKSVRFEGLKPGEYSLNVRGLAVGGAVKYKTTYERIGIGLVAAAIGDSITEGYLGTKFPVEREDLDWTQFKPENVSRDGRNFPQFGPTTAAHMGKPHVLQGFQPELNDLLTASLKEPVYIANEGWGGITSGGYLALMGSDTKWQARMKTLKPTLWLIHLGVNDERGKVAAADFAKNMEAIIDLLQKDYGAEPKRILIARPCHDYHPGAAEILTGYIKQIDELIARKKLSPGPDFFAAYAQDKERLYGTDPVHPNLVGMTYMAQLWHASIIKSLGLKR